MTTYKLGNEIYEETIRSFIVDEIDDSAALEWARKRRAEARQEVLSSRSPDFRPPYVSYIPAYGVNFQIRAALDYCKLKRLMTRSPQLRDFMVKKFDPERWQLERGAFDFDDEPTKT